MSIIQILYILYIILYLLSYFTFTYTSDSSSSFLLKRPIHMSSCRSPYEFVTGGVHCTAAHRNLWYYMRGPWKLIVRNLWL